MGASSGYIPPAAKSAVLTVLTSTSPGDLGSIAIPANITRYIIRKIAVVAKTAAGTLALATVDLRTVAAGGGSSVLSGATALVAASAAGKVVDLSSVSVITDALTASTLFVRQTVDSANAGTIIVSLELTDLSG